MKKVVYLVLFGVCLFVLTSCGSLSKTGYLAPLISEVQTDIKADLDINQNKKVEAKASSWYLLGFLRIIGDNKFTETTNHDLNNSIFGNRITQVKSAAVYKALEQSDADILITPKYDTQTKSYLFGLIKGYKVKVSGYEGKIKNVYQKNK